MRFYYLKGKNKKNYVEDTLIHLCKPYALEMTNFYDMSIDDGITSIGSPVYILIDLSEEKLIENISKLKTIRSKYPFAYISLLVPATEQVFKLTFKYKLKILNCIDLASPNWKQEIEKDILFSKDVMNNLTAKI